MNTLRRIPPLGWLLVSLLVCLFSSATADEVIVTNAAIKIEIVGDPPAEWTTRQPVDGGNGTFYLLYAGNLQNDQGQPIAPNLKLRFTPLGNFKLLSVNGNDIPADDQSDPFTLNNFPVKSDIAKELSFTGQGLHEDPEGCRLIFLPVDVVGPELKAIPELKFARMEDSLKAEAELDVSKDEDRFYVRIGKSDKITEAAVKVASSNNPDESYNDDPTKITLAVEGKNFLSEPLILVSDDVDDNHDDKDNDSEDQTHKAQLGGAFQVKSVTINGQTFEKPIDFKIAAGRNVNLKVFLVGDARGFTEENINLHIESTVRERFAQVGVWIDDISVKAAAWKPKYGAAVPFYVREKGGDGDLRISPGATALLQDAAAIANGDIVVLYVPTLFDRTEDDTIRQV